MCSSWFNRKYDSIDSDNGLATSRRQAIIWTNGCLGYWHICASLGLDELTHWGLVTPYGDRDLGQHWLRKWLVAWRHQAITWTNVDWSSVKSSGIHIRSISQEMPQPSITKICLKIRYLKYHSNFPGTNELKINENVHCIMMDLWVIRAE